MNSSELATHPLSQVARVLTWGALGLLFYGITSWMVAQPWFALTTMEVKTPVVHITQAQIRLVAERQVRGTFFTVDLDHVRNSLEKLPWVREARVERHWPDTLEVSLVEHVPLARWNDDALVNEAGEIFVAAVSSRLPRLSGPKGSSAEVVATYRRYQAALVPLGMTISELRLSPRQAWRLRLDNGMQLALGREKTDLRLARFVAIYPRLFGTQKIVQATTATTLDKVSGVASEAVVHAESDVAPVAPVVPVMIDLRYPDGFAIRMPDGVSPFELSKT